MAPPSRSCFGACTATQIGHAVSKALSPVYPAKHSAPVGYFARPGLFPSSALARISPEFPMIER